VAHTGAIFHPIHRDDLARILARAVVSDTPRGVLELGSRRPLPMPALIELALGEPVVVLVPLGSLRLAGRACSLMGSRGRVLSDRLLGLVDLQPMADPQDGALGVDCRPLGPLESPPYAM